MRLNKYIALRTSHSRRAADGLIFDKRVLVNDQVPRIGQDIGDDDTVKIDGNNISGPKSKKIITAIINKPPGYVCSREGQGSKTVYELLPAELAHLNSVGRLDKDSAGLLLLTNDGELANRLAHPRYQKVKVYDLKLDKGLRPLHQQMISVSGVELSDGTSRLQIKTLDKGAQRLRITMKEGRNRQIRRTFETLGYKVESLNRIIFGEYKLNNLPQGEIILIPLQN